MFWLLVNAFTVNVAIIESGNPAGVTMVVNQNGASEWEEHADTGARLDCGDRCIIAGLGCHLQGHTNRDQWSQIEWEHHINYLELLAERLRLLNGLVLQALQFPVPQ